MLLTLTASSMRARLSLGSSAKPSAGSGSSGRGQASPVKGSAKQKASGPAKSEGRSEGAPELAERSAKSGGGEGRSGSKSVGGSKGAAAAAAEAVQPAAAGPMLKLTDLPRFTREELGLHGLSLSTDLLVGADAKSIDAIREAADRASCPCLLLVESEPQALGAEDEPIGGAAIERMNRVVQAAQRLGCNSTAVRIKHAQHPDAVEFVIERLRRVLKAAERMEMNLLLAPNDGFTSDPERLTDLVKRVGGFRIGTFPDFQTAALTSDGIAYLRRLVPYAAALCASSVEFSKTKKPPGVQHEGYDLSAFAKTVESVGYQGTLAVDYRGAGDPVEGIRSTRALLESVLGLEVAEA